MSTLEGTMTTQLEATLYVWRRNTESKPSRWIWWAIGGIVLLSGFGAFAAYMADNGEISTFVGLGIVGSVLVWLIPRAFSWGRRRNPDITMEGREMVWAKKRVSIDSVERYSVRQQTTSFYNGTMMSSMTIGVVEFVMSNGSKEQRFTFAHLTEAEIAELVAAIDPILPGRRID